MSLLKDSSDSTLETMTRSVLTREKERLCRSVCPKAAEMNRKSKKKKMFPSSEEQLLRGAEHDISLTIESGCGRQRISPNC